MTNKHKRRSKKSSPSTARCGFNDDIVVQLQRQRQKQQSAATGSPNESKESIIIHKNVSVASSAPTHGNSERKTAGHFQYDPLRERYFPKSIFTSRGNYDPCAQRIRNPTPGDKVTNATANNVANERLHQLSGGNMLMKDVRSIVFRGKCLSEICNSGERASQRKRMRKKQRDDSKACYNQPNHLCTERTILLLTCSLEYCSSVHRRNAIVSTVLSPIVLARRAKIIPNMSTLDDIRKETTRFNHSAAHNYNEEANRRQIQSHPAWKVESLNIGTTHPGINARKSLQWFSILHPLQRRGDLQLLQNQQMQLNDSNCKLYLQPTVPTFDVLCSDNKTHSTVMPHIATISNNAIFYRTPLSNSEGRTAWELKSQFIDLQYQGVRLLNSRGRLTRNISYDGPLIGCMVHDPTDDRQKFVLYRANSINHGRNLSGIYILDSAVNDFCFRHDESLQVAFAHGGDKNNSGVSIIDIFSAAHTDFQAVRSEPLCLQFRSNSWNYNILLGHRDGSVSMLDTRSQDALFADLTLENGGSLFGSATSIRPLKRDDNLVLVKGSFGACRLMDIRKLSNNIESARHGHSTIMELSLSDHIVHQTKSTRCTGLAVDPSENIAVAPFASQNGDVHFAIWDICNTGRLLRTVNLKSNLDASNSNTSGNDAAAFCELSDVVTPGFEMSCDEDSETPSILSKGWGLWFKTNLSMSTTHSDSIPSMGGSIHHIKF